MNETFVNFASFIRLKVCLFISTIGIIGFLLFNKLDARLLFVFLSSFFITAGSYSLNNLTDVKEDKVNRKSVNPLAIKKTGLAITSVCFAAGVLFALFLPLASVAFCLIGVATSLHYSKYKVKKYFLVKNIYTGFGISIVFFVGSGIINLEVLSYYLLILFFIIVMSMISDIRDYKGDKANRFNTMPVALGYKKALSVVFLLCCIFSLSVVFFSHFLFLLPFSLSISYSIYKNRPFSAHSLGLYSFIFLTFWLLLGGV